MIISLVNVNKFTVVRVMQPVRAEETKGTIDETNF